MQALPGHAAAGVRHLKHQPLVLLRCVTSPRVPCRPAVPPAHATGERVSLALLISLTTKWLIRCHATCILVTCRPAVPPKRVMGAHSGPGRSSPVSLTLSLTLTRTLSSGQASTQDLSQKATMANDSISHVCRADAHARLPMSPIASAKKQQSDTQVERRSGMIPDCSFRQRTRTSLKKGQMLQRKLLQRGLTCSMSRYTSHWHRSAPAPNPSPHPSMPLRPHPHSHAPAPSHRPQLLPILYACTVKHVLRCCGRLFAQLPTATILHHHLFVYKHITIRGSHVICATGIVVDSSPGGFWRQAAEVGQWPGRPDSLGQAGCLGPSPAALRTRPY